MLKVTRLLSVLAIVLACCQSALAFSYVGTAVSTSGNTGNVSSALGTTPVNGSLVSVLVYSNATGGAAPTSIKDSNGVALTSRTSGINGNVGIWVYDGMVLGSPNGTYTCTINAASSCGQIIVVNVNGVATSGTYVSSNGTVLGTPSSGALTTTAGALLLCGLNSSTAMTLAISNSSGLTSIQATGGDDASYATSTSTTSTCTGSAAAGASYGIVMAQYPLAPILPVTQPPFYYPLNFRGA